MAQVGGRVGDHAPAERRATAEMGEVRPDVARRWQSADRVTRDAGVTQKHLLSRRARARHGLALHLEPGIELVSRSAAIERGRPAVEIELSAWARAQFRLPVIQVVVNDVCASTDLVLAMGPADVVRAGEAPVVAEGGVPSLWVANRREARNDK